MTDDNLVPGPQASILDAVTSALGDGQLAGQVTANPRAAGSLIAADQSDKAAQAAEHIDKQRQGEGGMSAGADSQAVSSEGNDADGSGEIPLKAVDEIGRATAMDVREALHQVIDPELGIDVVDLGLVYGIEVDSQGRAIITMTLTTPACPLTDLIEDECASTLAGLVEEFRIDWTWQPRWNLDMIRPEGREQLSALGFNMDNLPTY
ncbi:hypothetical protein CRD60_00105 [Bifidobacterium aemilianum]|uniref:MIP18 family-like domain-containing protein n=2 Tax=Bifidobacterium aemilianum TaxID=2493120 RepID=A0A366KBT3_9BIFI|nr:metal-sulfur cluster assembly factor [Bifidobacterium aemilianum]RBP98648.1 hypothetical protein CRD60_00105 [Bifidobacterium aemilianum]